MNETSKQLNTILFIRDQSEYQLAVGIINTLNITNYDILTIKDSRPYFSSEYECLDHVSTWRKYGVTESDLSRYWLENYKLIDELITSEISKDEKYINNKYIQSTYFKFSLVMLLGPNVYEPIHCLNHFFLQANPKLVYYTQKNTIIGKVLKQLITYYNIEHRNYS